MSSKKLDIKKVNASEKWHPEEGAFTWSATKLAAYLKKESPDYSTAMKRLTWYKTREGSKLKDADRKRLDQTKKELRRLYGRDQETGKPLKGHGTGNEDFDLTDNW